MVLNLQLYLPLLPFNQRSRNNRIRPEIIKRVLGLVLTDDERAELLGLPNGCRIRESAKIISLKNLNIVSIVGLEKMLFLTLRVVLRLVLIQALAYQCLYGHIQSHLSNLNMSNDIGSSLIARNKTTIGSGTFIGGPSVIFSLV